MNLDDQSIGKFLGSLNPPGILLLCKDGDTITPMVIAAPSTKKNTAFWSGVVNQVLMKKHPDVADHYERVLLWATDRVKKFLSNLPAGIPYWNEGDILAHSFIDRHRNNPDHALWNVQTLDMTDPSAPTMSGRHVEPVV